MGKNLNSQDGTGVHDKTEWGTPQDFFDYCDYKYGKFTLDAAASPSNAKCKDYYTKDDDALSRPWVSNAVWLNPPYGRDTTWKFVQKAWEEVHLGHSHRVVCLLPAAVDTRWFHYYCKRGLVVFIRGRLRFEGANDPAPFPSMLTIFANNINFGIYDTLHATTLDWR